MGPTQGTFLSTHFAGPTSFGPSGPSRSDDRNGDLFGDVGSLGYLEVPFNYTSGTLLSATDAFTGATFSSLGLTPGTYTWTWGTGANADFLTVNIGTASVPEPTSLMMLGTGTLTMLGYARRRRRALA